MSFNACRIIDVDMMDGLPGGPRVQCSCDNSLIQVGHYAQHVANAVSKDLIERCVKAEAALAENRALAKRLHDERAQESVMLDHAYAKDAARVTGKQQGVSLVRSYIEEVPR